MTTHVRAQPATDQFKAWFDEKLEVLLPVAETIVKVEEHAPILRVYMKSGTVGTYLVPQLDSAEAKDIAALLHRESADIPDVEASMFLCEAWTVRQGTDNKPLTGGLAEHPDRQEALMINCIMRNMRLVATVEIIGSFETNDRRFGKKLIVDANALGSSTVGRFTDQPTRKLDS